VPEIILVRETDRLCAKIQGDMRAALKVFQHSELGIVLVKMEPIVFIETANPRSLFHCEHGGIHCDDAEPIGVVLSTNTLELTLEKLLAGLVCGEDDPYLAQ